MKAIKLLFLSGILALTSCGKEQFYAGTYEGSIDVRVYSFDDNDLDGPYTQDSEFVQFYILSDDEGDYFTWDNCFISQGVYLPSPDPVYINNRGKGKLSFHFEQDIWEFDIKIKVDIDDSGVMQYEAKVLECTDVSGNGRFGMIVYEGELQG